MELLLIVSLDPRADSFLSSVLDLASEWPRGRDPQQECFTYPSTEWRRDRVGAGDQAFDKLGEQILSELAGRQVSSVDICLLLSAPAPEALDAFLPLCLYLEERCPDAPTTRRAYILLPSETAELKHFMAAFADLMRKATTTRRRLDEVHLIGAQGKVDASQPSWPLGLKGAFGMLRFMDGCSGLLTQALTPQDSPCCNSFYGRIWYDREAWKQYYVLRSRLDLTARERINGSPSLERRAEEFIGARRAIEECYEVGAVQSTSVKLVMRSSLATDERARIVESMCEEFLTQRGPADAQLLKMQEMKVEKLGQAYGRLLADLIEQELDSLSGVEQSRYLHVGVLKLIDSPFSHGLLLKTVVRPRMIRLINEGIRYLRDIAGQDMLQSLPAVADDDSVHRKIAQVLSIAESLSQQSTAQLPVLLALTTILGHTDCALSLLAALDGGPVGDDQIRAMLQKPFASLLAEHLAPDMMREAVLEACRGLDEGHAGLKAKHAKAVADLRALRRDFGLWRRLVDGAYKRQKRDLKLGIRQAQKDYKHWGRMVSGCLSFAAECLAFHADMRLVRRFFAARRSMFEQTGSFLVRFDQQLDAFLSRADADSRKIPEGPVVRQEVEVSFLSRSNMERLYQKFTRPTIREYVRWLTGKSGLQWGAWALSHLDSYLEKMPEYVEKYCWQSLPSLDLPNLMFVHFPDDLDTRLQHLVAILSSHVIPLVPGRHLNERRYHLIYGFPRAHVKQLMQHRPALDFENRSLTLNPAQIEVVDNRDDFSLDLIFSVAGVRVEDHQYRRVFDHDSPIPQAP